MATGDIGKEEGRGREEMKIKREGGKEVMEDERGDGKKREARLLFRAKGLLKRTP